MVRNSDAEYVSVSRGTVVVAVYGVDVIDVPGDAVKSAYAVSPGESSELVAYKVDSWNRSDDVTASDY